MIGRARPRSCGTTVIELLLALVVVGIFSTIAFGSYQQFVMRTRYARAVADISELKLLIMKYRVNNDNNLPLELSAVAPRVRLDPWGNQYEYLNFSAVHGNGRKRKDHNLVPINSEFDLYSKGPDGRSVSPLTAAASRDDIIMANNGAFIGKASEY